MMCPFTTPFNCTEVLVYHNKTTKGNKTYTDWKEETNCLYLQDDMTSLQKISLKKMTKKTSELISNYSKVTD